MKKNMKMSLLAKLVLVIWLSINYASAAPINTLQWQDLSPADWNPNKVFEELSEEQYMSLTDDQFMALQRKAQLSFNEAPVVGALDGKRIKIAGYVLPLEFRNTALLEFLFVPYFGACTHTPPPPANQIIFGKLNAPVKFDDIYEPVWITGTLLTERVKNQISESNVANELDVQSAYTMTVESLEPYELYEL